MPQKFPLPLFSGLGEAGYILFRRIKLAHCLVAVLFLTQVATADDSNFGRKPSTDKTVGVLETVAELYGPTVTGITVSKAGRIFVSFPRWTDPVQYSMAEIKGGIPVPYPNQEIFDESLPASDRLICVQSCVVDSHDRLWALDSGSVLQGPVMEGGPKLVAFDLATGKILQKIIFPNNVLRPKSYLDDVRFDLERGGGWAFITDCKDVCALIVVDLATGKSYRRLEGDPSVMPHKDFMPVIEGRPVLLRETGAPPGHLQTGCDGIAITPDRGTLFYAPLSGRTLYSIPVADLVDLGKTDRDLSLAVTDHGDNGTAADGFEMDNKGRLYLASLEHDAILRRLPNGDYDTVVHDPRLLWPDTLSIAPDGYLYMTVNQLHRRARFHNGTDLREKPWMIFRVKIDAGPAWMPPADGLTTNAH